MRYALVACLSLGVASPAIATPDLAPPARVILANAEIPDLSDALRLPFHQMSYSRLMSYWGANVPTWIRRFNQTGDGVQNEMRDFMFKGKRLQIAEVSRPHATDTASLYVIFNDNREPTVAWGYYVSNGSGSWVGVPPLDLAEFVEKLIARQDSWN